MNKIGNRKKFQNGSEIFDLYVPNFQRSPKSLEEQGIEMVTNLLEKFDNSLKAGIKKSREEEKHKNRSQKGSG